MRRWLLVWALGAILAGCGGSSSSDAEPASESGDTAIATTTIPKASTASNGVVVDGTNGFTLAIEDFGDSASWWYDSTTVTAKLCGELTTDRTLRVYRSTDAENQGGVFCENGGGTILNFEAGRELESPDENGAIKIMNGDVGVITSGGDTFGKSDIGTVTVEVRSSGDPTIPAAVADIEVTADTGKVKVTFKG